MVGSLLTPIGIDVPIVDPIDGTPTPYFQQLLQKLAVNATLTVTNGKLGLADGSVTTVQIADGTIATIDIANNAITYSKMQDIATTKRVLGRNSAGAGDPEEVSLTQLLDWIGSAAQGDILYRDATSWARLAAGTSGQFLKTNGAGANPAWATVSGGGGGGGFESSGTLPVAANFTVLNAGTSVMADSTYGLTLINTTASGQLHFAKSNTAIASTTFTLTQRSRGLYPLAGGNYQAALLIRNSTSGRLLVFGTDNSDARLFASTWSSYSAFVGAFLNTSAFNAAVYPWKRIVCTAGSMSFEVSTDGIVWWQMATSNLATYLTAAGGTVDQAGFAIYSANAGTICNSYTLV